MIKRKCFLCNKDATRAMSKHLFNQAMDVESTTDAYLCDEHHKKLWNIINKQEFWATVFVFMIPVGVVAFIVLMWLASN